jgi:hypothetical protein
MNRIVLPTVVSTVLLGSGCTTIHPTDASPAEIQRLIIAEGLLAPGDKVRLVTADDALHEFRITGINLDEGSVHGKDDQVRIEEIIAVQTRDFAFGKTIGLSYGIASVVVVVVVTALGGSLAL